MIAVMLLAVTLAAQDGAPAVPAQVVAEEKALEVSAAAPTEAELKEAAENVAKFRQAYGRGDHAAAVAAGLMFLVWVLRRFKKSGALAKKPDLVPWVAVAISVATSSAAALTAGFPIYDSAMAGLVVGMASAGGWSLLGKHLLPKPAPEPVITFKQQSKEDAT